ncbi:phospholipid phosphatase 2 isoform X2 [Meriones unguiculatus]|uniref:phospholipid phosphatase 2 isoform X2 n=1 Tax=Meriones unguiculatus TaxID=10047 RepID=UPI00293F2ECE|nr:phospholipid phosphatase 2 isoform X2 [Meriones unguiculatus]
MERRWVFVLLDVLCVLVASLPFVILTLVNAPYKRGFYCGDDSIRYPYRPDTITHGLMAGVIITATVILVSSGEAYLVYTDRLYSRSDFNNYVAAIYKVLGTFLFGAAVSQSLTDLAKYMIGRLRPSFLAVCDPDWSRINCSGYVQLEVCRGSPANVTEASLHPSVAAGSPSSSWLCLPVPLTGCPPSQAVLLLRALLLWHVLHGVPGALRAGPALLEVGPAAEAHCSVLLGGLCDLCGLYSCVRPQAPLE